VTTVLTADEIIGSVEPWLAGDVCYVDRCFRFRSIAAHGTRGMAPPKRACTGPGSAQWIVSRPPALILIAVPSDPKLSLYRIIGGPGEMPDFSSRR
jgi:hypothetical protein